MNSIGWFKPRSPGSCYFHLNIPGDSIVFFLASLGISLLHSITSESVGINGDQQVFRDHSQKHHTTIFYKMIDLLLGEISSNLYQAPVCDNKKLPLCKKVHIKFCITRFKLLGMGWQKKYG